MDLMLIDKNINKIVKATNKHLEKYNYKTEKGENIVVDVDWDKEFHHFVVYPLQIVWSNYILDWNGCGDIFLINESTQDSVKLVSQGYMYKDAPELIINKLFLDLVEERDYLETEIKEYEERADLGYECFRSED